MPPIRPPVRRLPASRVLSFIDANKLERILIALLPDPQERAFVQRSILEEGPIHHRGANWILLALLAEQLKQTNRLENKGAEVSMRLPPHLADKVDEAAYPLRLPTEPLEQLAQGDPEQVAAMVDCLTDGPPHHALANVLMVQLIGALKRGAP